LVTGASGVLGSAIAQVLEENEFNVYRHYNSHFIENGYCADFSDYNSIDRMVEVLPGIDVLVNNAGVALYGLFQDISVDEFDNIFQINIKAPMYLTRKLLPYMLRQKAGHIVNISSIWGEEGASCEVDYSAAKAALIGFSKALKLELEPSGIKVDCICPKMFKSPMTSRFFESDFEDNYTSEIQNPTEIAKTILKLIQKT
ncbi:MAG: SDR family NAD(P)-dependent oxidoreductase, partial [Ruminococcus sp.]|nr:SDR family NAD(P)-dependent oxidoreductase [Ruminococcus sp.]